VPVVLRVFAAVSVLGVAGVVVLAKRGADATVAVRTPAPRSPPPASGPGGLPAPYAALEGLHSPKTPPRPGEWLAEHPEPGQTLAQWRQGQPVRATPERRTIVFQPVGAFTPAQQQVVELTAEYTRRFFGLPVQMHEAISPNEIPSSARRSNPFTGHPQVLTTHVLEALIARRPEHAVAYIALMGEDLYPDPSWNFVFGQATFHERVGVWSMWRYGDPAASREDFDKALRHTVLIAVHELGHMFSVHHCTRWECVMNGVNHLDEAASRPLEPCAEDLAKLCEATGCDLLARFDALGEFWKQRQAERATVEHLQRARERVAAVP
jgi:archaemetzincin